MKQTTVSANDRASTRNGAAPKRAAKHRVAGPRVPDASREAKRIAASVLEVLAGASSPTAAATALDMSLPRYYLTEQRAIEALVAACEPRGGGGRTLSPQREIEVVRKQLERTERESTRYQTLLRIAQRTIGLVPAPQNTAKNKGSAKSKRKRRPTARALVAARNLRAEPDNGAASASADSPAATPDDKGDSRTIESPLNTVTG